MWAPAPGRRDWLRWGTERVRTQDQVGRELQWPGSGPPSSLPLAWRSDTESSAECEKVEEALKV